MLEVLVDNISVVFGGGGVFQQIVGIPNCTNRAPLLADIFLYSYKVEFMQYLLSTGKKQLASQFNFSYRFIDDTLSIITKILRSIWVRCIPLSLRSKTQWRATPLLPTWIYSCRLGGTVSCEFPFTTNVTISTSISQTFLSWVAIFHLSQPMAFLSHIIWHSGTWPYTVTTSNDQTLQQFVNLLQNWTVLPILTLLSNFRRFP